MLAVACPCPLHCFTFVSGLCGALPARSGSLPPPGPFRRDPSPPVFSACPLLPPCGRPSAGRCSRAPPSGLCAPGRAAGLSLAHPG